MSARTKELLEKRAKAIADMRAVVEQAETAGRKTLNAEDQAKYNALNTEQKGYGDEIAREKELAELERTELSVVADRQKKPDTKLTPAELEAKAFSQFIAMGDKITPELRAALRVGSDSEGGYTVAPEVFVRDLIKSVDNMVHIRRLATVLPLTEAQSLGVPSLDADPADADWTTELLTGSEDSTMAFGKRALFPLPLAKLIKISGRLLRLSALSPETLVRERLAYKFAVSQEKAFLTGSGVGAPLGVFVASANGISTGRDISTGNTTTGIKFDGLLGAKYALKPQYRNSNGISWIFHRDAMLQIAKLKDGDGQYIWRPSVVAGEPDRLLGLPYNESEYAPSTFTTGLYVGILGDFSKYWIADSLQMQVQRLVELYAATAQVGFIARMESDGMPVLEEAFARVALA